MEKRLITPGVQCKSRRIDSIHRSFARREGLDTVELLTGPADLADSPPLSSTRSRIESYCHNRTRPPTTNRPISLTTRSHHHHHHHRALAKDPRQLRTLHSPDLSACAQSCPQPQPQAPPRRPPASPPAQTRAPPKPRRTPRPPPRWRRTTSSRTSPSRVRLRSMPCHAGAESPELRLLEMRRSAGCRGRG